MKYFQHYYTGVEANVFDSLGGGLYLVGTCVFNPTNEDEKYYWIKVGKASCFGSRMRNYNTHNPMLWKGSFLPCEDKKFCHYLEKIFQDVLRVEAIGKHDSRTSEWFRVSKEVYLKICNNGFNFFKNHPQYKHNCKVRYQFLDFSKIPWDDAVQAS